MAMNVHQETPPFSAPKSLAPRLTPASPAEKALPLCLRHELRGTKEIGPLAPKGPRISVVLPL